jgi:hypothetical protein
MEKEEWCLGPASASVARTSGRALIELRGIVTAQAFEALHRRMASESASHLRLSVTADALLVATPRSLAEAASRGTRAGDTRRVTLIVPAARRVWAGYHLVACRHEGLSRRLAPSAGRVP